MGLSRGAQIPKRIGLQVVGPASKPLPWPRTIRSCEHPVRTYSGVPSPLKVFDKHHIPDEWTNVTPSLLGYLGRRLHLQPDHPLCLTRKLITSRFPSPLYTHFDDLTPVVTVQQNFDSLGFPKDHPGRSRTDTYYINAHTCLRTHTSAHQADTFRSDTSDGYTITADVYRRDAIDRSHYPVFHQMEGARVWDRRKNNDKKLADIIWSDVRSLSQHQLIVEDQNPTVDVKRNPLQHSHNRDEVEAIAAHLKRSLKDVVVTIFSAAHSQSDQANEPLRVRWVEAFFPFTSPSWELEVLWQGEWLEVLGCGIVQQAILDGAKVPDKIGWAFGLGLERIAMLLYNIPDIRLFWSTDERFLTQFKEGQRPSPFVPFSKYPACWKDISFWLPENVQDTVDSAGAEAAGGPYSTTSSTEAVLFHENDMMELVRQVGGDLVEDVKLVDEFKHPKTNRKSMCYRINYRSLERTLKNEEVNELHEAVRSALSSQAGIELR